MRESIFSRPVLSWPILSWIAKIPIRSRMAINFILAFSFTLILTSWICFEVFVGAHRTHFDASLYNHAIDVASAIDMGFFGSIEIHSFPDTQLEKREPFAVQRSFMQLRNLSGGVLARSSNLRGNQTLPLSEMELRNTLLSGVNYRTLNGPGEDGRLGTNYRLISYLVKKGGMVPLVLQIAVPMTLVQESQSDFLILLLFVVPMGIALSSGLAFWASRRIENSLRARDRFVADASHQMKTPLAIIQGELELLQLKYSEASKASAAPTLTSEFGEGLSTVSQEVSQLITLTENLLLLAKMDAGLETLTFQLVRLDELCTEVVQRLRRMGEKLGIQFVLEFKPFDQANEPSAKIDFEISGDPHLLRSMMENLVENAMKYSAGRGQKVRICLKELQDRFVFEVTDQGPGFSETELAGLFKRFQRDPEKSLQVQGSGLGLVIVKRIAELHRGDVSISSKPENGTVATVYLMK